MLILPPEFDAKIGSKEPENRRTLNFERGLLVSVLLCSCLYAGNGEYEYLDQLALQAETDKGSSGHNYTEIYAPLFLEFRDQPIKFLEIGIDKGASAKLWEGYFPNADLHFIDIRYSDIQYFSERVKYYILDQENRDELKSFINFTGGDFDIILDDGGHKMKQQIVSFETLFPYLKSGGLYIIEDLHTSYWELFGGHGSKSEPLAGQGTTVEFLKNLVEDLNYTGAATGSANFGKVSDSMKSELNPYQRDIYSIQFYKSLCIIKKR